MDQTIEKRNAEEVKAILDKTISIVDRAASKGVIHKNKAANYKSALTLLVNKMK